MKRIKIQIQFVKSSNGTIQFWIDNEHFETEIKSETKLLEKMKFFIRGRSNTAHFTKYTANGVIKNVRIESGTHNRYKIVV